LGSLVFGLQLKSVQKAYESKRRENLIKLANNCILSILEKCAKKIAIKMQFSFSSNIKGIYHQSDEVKLKAIEFSVNKTNFQVNFRYKDQIKKILKFNL